jgi:hypothetical protein
MDKEKLYRRLYASFANQLEKTEGDNTRPKGEGNTQEENDYRFYHCHPADPG